METLPLKKFGPELGKIINANGVLVLCSLGDFSSALNLHEDDVNTCIDDFANLDKVDNKVYHTVIFYLCYLRRNLET